MPRAYVIGVPAISDPDWGHAVPAAGPPRIRLPFRLHPILLQSAPPVHTPAELAGRRGAGRPPSCNWDFMTSTTVHGFEIVAVMGVPRVIGLATVPVVVLIWKPL